MTQHFAGIHRSPTTPGSSNHHEHIDTRIAARAGMQHGAIHDGQLRALGLSRHQIAARVRRGQLHRRHPKVYFVGHRRTDLLAEAAAAALALTGTAAVCGRCASELFGFYDRGRPIVEVVSTKRHRLLDGVAVRWTRALPTDELTTWQGIPITTPARTILDMAEYCTEFEVAFAIHEARRLRLLRLSDLERVARRYPTRRGAPTLRRAIALHRAGSAGTRSSGEDVLRRMFDDAGLPAPQVNVRVPVLRGHVECDFYWPELRLNVELDGSEHRLPSRVRTDKARDARLARVSIDVCRYPSEFMVAAVEEVERRLSGR